MTWGELLRITPGMFIALEKQRSEAARANMFGFRFLATVVGRMMGSDVDYMSDDKRGGGLISLDDTEAYMQALAANNPPKEQDSQ